MAAGAILNQMAYNAGKNISVRIVPPKVPPIIVYASVPQNTEWVSGMAVVEFVSGLNLHGITLDGESLGAALALSASIDLEGRVKRVVAFNSYDYPGGLERGNWLARLIITSVRMPGLGLVFASLEPRPIMRAVLHGGFVDHTKLPEHFLVELLRSGRRTGYSSVARAVCRSLTGFNRA
jgi:pimeloyl-ACP methyl ester carboxylesterase